MLLAPPAMSKKVEPKTPWGIEGPLFWCSQTSLKVIYKLSTKYEVDIDEEDVLPDGWTRFYPVCTKNNIATYNFEVTSSKPLDIYIVPSKQDYELFTKGQQSTNYPKCQERGTNFYQKTCTVESGSGVILKNPSDLLGGNTAQFKIKVKEN